MVELIILLCCQLSPNRRNKGCLVVVFCTRSIVCVVCSTVLPGWYQYVPYLLELVWYRTSCSLPNLIRYIRYRAGACEHDVVGSKRQAAAAGSSENTIHKPQASNKQAAIRNHRRQKEDLFLRWIIADLTFSDLRQLSAWKKC